MRGNKEKYDLICSLGGNCAAAHNLLYKGIRTVAFPFDWTYFNSDEAVYRLVDGFKNNFKNYALKENFKELPVNSDHSDKIQYEDTYGKIIWANHFLYNTDQNANYNEVKEKLDRRFQRLINYVKKAQKILFIFSTSFQIKPDAFLYLISNLNKMYPNKNIEIKVLSFSCEKDYVYEDRGVKICYYKRKMDLQDFDTTNKEWEFLDKVEIKYKLFDFKKKLLTYSIRCIPFKFLRKKLRKKYHVK